MKLIIDVLKATLIFENPYTLPDDDVRQRLEGASYKSSPGIIVAIAPDGSGAQVLVWKKENKEIGYDPTRGFLTVQSQEFEGASTGLREMVRIVREMNEDYMAGVSRCEIIMNARTKGKKYPLVAFADLLGDEFLPDIGKVFEKAVSPFAIRVCPRDAVGSKDSLRKIPEWFELTIQPMVENPTYYVVNLVYRNPDVDNVVAFADGLGAKMERLMSAVEGQG